MHVKSGRRGLKSFHRPHCLAPARGLVALALAGKWVPLSNSLSINPHSLCLGWAQTQQQLERSVQNGFSCIHRSFDWSILLNRMHSWSIKPCLDGYREPVLSSSTINTSL